MNLRGTFFLSQAVARHMVSATSPHYRSIVNISSMASHIASFDRTQYAIKKAAVSKIRTAFRRAPRRRADLRARGEASGFIKTPMTAGHSERIDKLIRSLVPVHRWGTPEDVARSVATLATGGLPYTTGESIWVAGGVTIPQVR